MNVTALTRLFVFIACSLPLTMVAWDRCSRQAGSDVSRAQQAVEMLLDLKRHAHDASLIQRIDGYAGDLSSLGPVLRNVRYHRIVDLPKFSLIRRPTFIYGCVNDYCEYVQDEIFSGRLCGLVR